MGISRKDFFQLKDKEGTNPKKKEDWYDEELNEIIYHLIQERKSKNMTQEQIAELCDCPRSTIARMESLISQPTVGTLMRYCKAVGLKLTIKRI